MISFLQQIRLEDVLHELFHVERHAVGLGNHVPDHLGGQCLAPGNRFHHGRRLFVCERVKGQVGEV